MSLDLSRFVTPMLDQASRWFGALLVPIAIAIGVSLGIVLVVLTVKAIQSILPHG
jgi:hypothetical protein